MQFHISTEKDIVTVLAAVTKIEVEDIRSSGDNDLLDEEYFRTIRFIGYDGEAIEVFCRVFDDKNVLKLHRVKKLKPLEKPQKVVDWLNPKVYKGKLDDEDK